MKIFEFQAKKTFHETGIPIPLGILASTSSAVKEALQKVSFPAVLKAQVLTGGRGKAGLIQIVTDEKAALNAADVLFGAPHNVQNLLVEEAVKIEREIYLAITFDPVKATALILASAEGGIDIEELAATHPQKIFREFVDLERGLQPYQIRRIAKELNLNGTSAQKAEGILKALWQIFTTKDAEMVEINPLFLTQNGDLIAGDGKLILDDNALWRQGDFEAGREYYNSNAEYEAAQEGIPYLQFEGNISLMCAGAGLTTTVYDLVIDEGGSVANYLEFGGPNYRRADVAMKLCLKNDSKVILVVTFGTIARADVMAQGIVNAIEELKPDRPVLACIRGTNEEDAVKILKKAGIAPFFDTEEAVRAAVALTQATGGNKS